MSPTLQFTWMVLDVFYFDTWVHDVHGTRKKVYLKLGYPQILQFRSFSPIKLLCLEVLNGIYPHVGNFPQVLQHWQHLANAENQLSTAVNAEAPIRDLGRSNPKKALSFMTVHTFSIISESIPPKKSMTPTPRVYQLIISHIIGSKVCKCMFFGFIQHFQDTFFIHPNTSENTCWSLVHHGSPWFTMVHHGSPWFTMVHRIAAAAAAAGSRTKAMTAFTASFHNPPLSAATMVLRAAVITCTVGTLGMIQGVGHGSWLLYMYEMLPSANPWQVNILSIDVHS